MLMVSTCPATEDRRDSAEGRLGASATFDGHTVTLRRKGYSRSVTGKGERSIPVGQIAAVEWKPAGHVMDGFIRFVVPGTIAPRSKFGRQSDGARFDEWAVPFWRKSQGQFQTLRAAVEAAIANKVHALATGNTTDELAKLAGLFQSGLLTPEEFATQKRRIMGG
jgi:hypothetical protein